MPPRVDLDVASHQDNVLLVSALALMSLGLTMVFISSHVMAQSQYQDPYFFIKRQSLYAFMGLAALCTGRFVNYQRYKALVYPLLFLSLITLVVVLIPGVGTRVRGAARWLRLGPITIQPSEFAKLALVFFLAYSLARKQDKMKYFSIGFLPHVIVAGLFIGLIGKEPDFGTAMTLAGIVFIMLLVGGVRLAYIFGAFIGVASLATLMILRDPKKFNRILSFLDPWKYGQDVGYQLKQSLLAIGSGGLFGLGPGQSRAKLFYLPDAHTDFILSIFSEELGFIGVLLILALFSLLVYRGVLLSLRAPDTFGSYLALGLTLLIGFQAGINMGVVTGIFPTKGLSLPFLSYGGSSLLATLLAVGILLNISSQIKRPKISPQPAGKPATEQKQTG
jgi:cell division protein FtsW